MYVMDWMKFRFLALWITLTIASPNLVYAGGGSDGGGNEYIAVFVHRANELIRSGRISGPDASSLNAALSSSQIVLVSVLIDERTNRPVPNQQYLIAWSSPGKIQLKMKHPGRKEDSWQKLVDDNRPTGAIVAHELYRAAGIVNNRNTSVDDTFQKSIGEDHLDQSSGEEVIEMMNSGSAK